AAPPDGGRAVGLAAVRTQPEPAHRGLVAGQRARCGADDGDVRAGHAADDGDADLVGRAPGAPLATRVGAAHGGGLRAVRRRADDRLALVDAASRAARRARHARLPAAADVSGGTVATPDDTTTKARLQALGDVARRPLRA